MPQGHPPISRRLAKSVLAEILEAKPTTDYLDPGARDEMAGQIIDAALSVRRVNTREHGETVVLTYVIPGDTDEKPDD